MNLIQKHADDFIWRYEEGGNSDYEEFLSELQGKLYNYRKDSQKIEFIERVIIKMRTAFDVHYEKCGNKENCRYNKFYESAIFFAQNELDEINQNLVASDFTTNEKHQINEGLNKILADLQVLKMSGQITYDDFLEEFKELKEMYFLNKKTWIQILTGKLTEMVAGGVISETLSKQIITEIKDNYVSILQS